MENLLQVLKLDATIVPQFFIFLLAYLILLKLVFEPYMKAFNKRKEATVGSKELADQLLLETQDIHFKYEVKAREINSELRKIYDAARKDALKLHEEILNSARGEAEAKLKTLREELSKNANQVRDELKKQIPEISRTISNHLLGKELH